ncbi:type III toxin-antitoxin system ToxN/AbiQ family toxin [Vibrio diazotrophicus]|uniref:Type III toxin-antitoxin system ToxN/AbiQ family toxin n=1 Tax=Vibrio diazotrophicus TaxID=685 RepID=A0ABX4W5Q7_VIBDI|nr:type III toxin-antitoxin system ToxN/AbiQ family toxin [Vibrio diazotrophicus]PNH98422.1 type III toxin-antitoxin system ToxN/AbiQ family toxin [Vibrio diazotrophicus]
MKFYTVTDDYIKHLKQTDRNVPDNYQGKRAYIGIVLEINNVKYLAPLTSYKAKQDKISSSTPSIYKIHEVDVPENKLGMIQLNNMIPVSDDVISELDVDREADPYKRMLQRQIVFIRKNSAAIVTRAQKLRILVVDKKHPHFSKISCDFVALEEAMGAYKTPESQPVSQDKLAALVEQFKL